MSLEKGARIPPRSSSTQGIGINWLKSPIPRSTARRVERGWAVFRLTAYEAV
ncbi:MAG: hypothetical protein K1T65_08000 [Candidatus Aramenus sp.]|nr:hypothetical protein [Candidatus Aramenus sp.]